MEIIKLTDIINKPDHPIMQEVYNSLNGKEGDIVICKGCGAQYARGMWNFYNLCDSCFIEFDKKKTEERLKYLKIK